jgi:hypothetical protein
MVTDITGMTGNGQRAPNDVKLGYHRQLRINTHDCAYEQREGDSPPIIETPISTIS